MDRLVPIQMPALEYAARVLGDRLKTWVFRLVAALLMCTGLSWVARLCCAPRGRWGVTRLMWWRTFMTKLLSGGGKRARPTPHVHAASPRGYSKFSRLIDVHVPPFSALEDRAEQARRHLDRGYALKAELFFEEALDSFFMARDLLLQGRAAPKKPRDDRTHPKGGRGSLVEQSRRKTALEVCRRQYGGGSGLEGSSEVWENVLLVHEEIGRVFGEAFLRTRSGSERVRHLRTIAIPHLQSVREYLFAQVAGPGGQDEAAPSDLAALLLDLSWGYGHIGDWSLMQDAVQAAENMLMEFVPRLLEGTKGGRSLPKAHVMACVSVLRQKAKLVRNARRSISAKARHKLQPRALRQGKENLALPAGRGDAARLLEEATRLLCECYDRLGREAERLELWGCLYEQGLEYERLFGVASPRLREHLRHMQGFFRQHAGLASVVSGADGLSLEAASSRAEGGAWPARLSPEVERVASAAGVCGLLSTLLHTAHIHRCCGRWPRAAAELRDAVRICTNAGGWGCEEHLEGVQEGPLFHVCMEVLNACAQFESEIEEHRIWAGEGRGNLATVPVGGSDGIWGIEESEEDADELLGRNETVRSEQLQDQLVHLLEALMDPVGDYSFVPHEQLPLVPLTRSRHLTTAFLRIGPVPEDGGKSVRYHGCVLVRDSLPRSARLQLVYYVEREEVGGDGECGGDAEEGCDWQTLALPRLAEGQSAVLFQSPPLRLRGLQKRVYVAAVEIRQDSKHVGTHFQLVACGVDGATLEREGPTAYFGEEWASVLGACS